MSDITKCEGYGLAKCETCYRRIAPEHDYQSYFTESPVEDEDCEYYWETEKEEE